MPSPGVDAGDGGTLENDWQDQPLPFERFDRAGSAFSQETLKERPSFLSKESINADAGAAHAVDGSARGSEAQGRRTDTADRQTERETQVALRVAGLMGRTAANSQKFVTAMT
jgi:hypothetical protein